MPIFKGADERIPRKIKSIGERLVEALCATRASIRKLGKSGSCRRIGSATLKIARRPPQHGRLDFQRPPYAIGGQGEDPSEFKIEAEMAKPMAERGFKLIHALKRIPGSDEHGNIDAERLAKWTETVRRSCKELSRIEIADVIIGELLALAPVGKDGVWPCEAVRTVMEDIQSEDMMRGAPCRFVQLPRGAYARSWRGSRTSTGRPVQKVGAADEAVVSLRGFWTAYEADTDLRARSCSGGYRSEN